ncbi:hypothetical protein ACH6CV_13575 [Bacillota bacterium Meth-B3]
MKRAFFHVYGRLMSGSGLVYAAGLAFGMGLLCNWLSLMERGPSFSAHFSTLCLYLMAALPLWTANAFGRGAQAEGPEARGRFWAYLAAHAAASLGLALYLLPIAPGALSFTALFGFFVTGAVLTGLCLWIAGRLRRRWAALAVALAALILLREAPELASALAMYPAGVWWARSLVRLSPFSLLGNFLNGLIDVKAVLYAAGFCVLAAALVGQQAAPPAGTHRPACGRPSKQGNRRALASAAIFILFIAAVALLPVNLTLIDVTPARVTVVSDGMARALNGLREPVTVHQVAGVGAEDVWIKTYLEKLAERHAFITYRLVDPAEDAQLKALQLEDNSLVVEQGDELVIVRAANLYAEIETTAGARHSFELEGALLTALSDITQIDMTYAGVPPGRTLDVPPVELTDGQARVLAYAFVGAPLALGIFVGLRMMRGRSREARKR